MKDRHHLGDDATEASPGKERRFPVDRAARRNERQAREVVKGELSPLGQRVIFRQDRDPRLSEQRLHGQGPLLGQPRLDSGQPDVKPLLAQGVHLLLGPNAGKSKAYVRKALSKEAQQRRKVGVVGPRERSDGDMPAFIRARPARGCDRTIHLVKSDLSFLEEVDPCGSKADRATLAIEELDPELRLESSYVPAQMGLGHLKPRCRTTEMPLFGNGYERVEEAELRHTSLGIELGVT